MMAPLPDHARVKLTKLLAMTQSNHAGERDAAILAANRLVRGVGLTWEEILETKAQKAASCLDRLRWRETACACLAGEVSDWEVGFLENILRRDRLTEKQAAVLTRIAAKAQVYA